MKKIVTLVFIFFVMSLHALENDCSKLSSTQCLKSTECTLELIPKDKWKPNSAGKTIRYLCQQDQNTCEKGFVQTDWPSLKEAKKFCEAKKGCALSEANCFCPCKGYAETKVPDTEAVSCNCGCGGGTPIMCRLK